MTAQPAKVSLLLADVDGTLVTHDKILTDRTRAAVQQLKAAGIAFAVTSGRPPLGMKMLIEPLNITTPIAGFNGGIYVRPDFSIMEQNVLPRAIVERVVALMVAHKLDVWIYRGNDWFVHEQHGPHVDRDAWTVKMTPTVVADFEPFLDQVAKVVGVSDDLQAVAQCETATQQAFKHQVECQAGASSGGGEQVSAARSQPYYLDVTHPQANKGAVVDRLAEILAIPRSQIATIGDMPNDVSMFKRSGVSIAMGNASAEVQAQAQYVTTSYEEEGFANAVERFILGLRSESASPQSVPSAHI